MLRDHIARRARTSALTAVLCLAPGTMAQAATSQPAAGSNIARGMTYVLSPAPNYEHCTDAADTAQLTDGRLTDGPFWTQRSTVGWNSAKYAVITIDLGRLQPIAGLSFRTAAGGGGVLWPTAIRVQISKDGRLFRDVGDLLELDSSARSLPTGYAVRVLATRGLKARGRYVRLIVIPTGPYIFCDEIEVFRGDESLLEVEPTAPPATAIEEAYFQYRVQAGVRRRFASDVEQLTQRIHASSLDTDAKDALTRRLEPIGRQLATLAQQAFAKDFKAILPYNKAHAELFAIQAALWRASGRPGFSAWAVCAWDPQELFPASSPQTSSRLEVHTLLGEHRSAAFNLANASEKPMQVSFSLAGLAGGPAPKFVTAYHVPWTDTGVGQPVTAALVELAPRGGMWTLAVPPGLTQQIWLEFHVTELPGGKHAGTVEMNVDGASQPALPLELNVYPVAFPARTTLWLGGWDYTDGAGSRGITPANHKPFVEFLRSHLINAPWATSQVMMKVSFENDRPVLDTSTFDEWLAQWPDAEVYLVFLAVQRDFAGTQMGTPAFERRVGGWISAWVRHLATKGVDTGRFQIHLVDEPRTPQEDETLIGWAKAIHAAEPQVRIWVDPYHKNPRQARAEMFEVCETLCPNRPMWLEEDKSFADFYLDQRRSGRQLNFYSCSGPARMLDPYAYYRLQAWHCWQVKGNGSFFWALGDNSDVSSWNEYPFTAGPFTPLFLDDTSVTSAKQMEGMRESAEDYEYFAMLEGLVKQAESRGRQGGLVAKARELLDHGADQVLAAEGTKKLNWHEAKDRTRADAVRIELLRAIQALSAAPKPEPALPSRPPH